MPSHDYYVCGLCFWHRMILDLMNGALSIALERYRRSVAAHCAVDRVATDVIMSFWPDMAGDLFFLDRHISIVGGAYLTDWFRRAKPGGRTERFSVFTREIAAAMAESPASGAHPLGVSGVMIGITPEEFRRRLSCVVDDVPDDKKVVTGYLDLGQMKMVPDRRSSRWPELVLSYDPLPPALSCLSVRSDVDVRVVLKTWGDLYRRRSAMKIAADIMFFHLLDLLDRGVVYAPGTTIRLRPFVSALGAWRKEVDHADGWDDVDRMFAGYGLSSMSEVFREIGNIVSLKVMEE